MTSLGALRRIAEHADAEMEVGGGEGYDEFSPIHRFTTTFTPSVVLALIESLEAAMDVLPDAYDAVTSHEYVPARLLEARRKCQQWLPTAEDVKGILK